jgi:hypothetical protein
VDSNVPIDLEGQAFLVGTGDLLPRQRGPVGEQVDAVSAEPAQQAVVALGGDYLQAVVLQDLDVDQSAR